MIIDDQLKSEYISKIQEMDDELSTVQIIFLVMAFLGMGYALIECFLFMLRHLAWVP